VATVTGLDGRPLAGQLVHFSADHKFVKVAPSFDPPVVTTDAQGEARTVLTSGDHPTAGQVTARCGEAEGAVAVTFELPTGWSDDETRDPESDLLIPGSGAHCNAPFREVLHLTWHGQPVRHHRVEFTYSAWLPGNTKSHDDQKNADIQYQTDCPPYGSFAPAYGVTDEDGVVVTWWRPGAAELAWLTVSAWDLNVAP
jgi:hypothetical protein